MTQFHHEHQSIWGIQQNAGGDIITNTVQKAAWTPPLMLPPRAQPFVGREEDLAWLLQQLTTSEIGVTLALCGPGGMGKTALAAEALTRLIHQEVWSVFFPDGIFYHSFYPTPSLAVAFEEVARVFGEEPDGDPFLVARRAASRRRALLVFDGVENLDDLHSLHELGGRNVILLLSRHQFDAPDPNHRLDIGLLHPEEAMTMLQKMAQPWANDRQPAEQLIQHIGGYPLALQLIGRYLSSRQETVADYLRWFEEKGLVTGALHQGNSHYRSVSVLLQRTYDSLEINEKDIFLLQGLFAPAPFPLELVKDILEHDIWEVKETFGSLVNLNVFGRLNEKSYYEVSHPLIHTFAKEYLISQVNATSFPSSETVAIWQERFLNTLAMHFEPHNRYDRNSFPLWYPHILHLASTNDQTSEQSLTTAQLFNSAGIHAFTQGKYAEAELLYMRALEIREQELGVQHPNTAQSLNNLALLYYNQGKYEQAEPLYMQALAICEQKLGAHHPNTAQSLNNLAELYRNQGKYEQAEPLYVRALAICKQELGAHHPNTAQGLNNLALLYYDQGKYKQAEPLYMQALEIREQELGTQHPDTAQSLNNLAELYRNQGKYEQAEPLYVRALEIREQELGTQHPDIATSLNNLALLYHTQGKYEQAKLLYVRALTICEQELGAQHLATAIGLNNLAELYRNQGKYEQAEPLYVRALEIREQELETQHPATAQSLNNLAALYYSQGKYEQAEPLYMRALEIQEQELGTQHPDTAQSLNNLAALYYSQGKYKQAESLYIWALEIQEQGLGAQHPDIATSLNNLAALHYSQGKYEQAEPLLMRALEIREQELGTQHPDTITSLNNLEVLYYSQGKYEQAEPLLMQALEIREQELGTQHPDTITNLNNLAGLYYSQGKYEQAEPLLVRALAILENKLGPNHPICRTIHANYTFLLQAMEQSRDTMQ